MRFHPAGKVGERGQRYESRSPAPPPPRAFSANNCGSTFAPLTASIQNFLETKIHEGRELPENWSSLCHCQRYLPIKLVLMRRSPRNFWRHDSRPSATRSAADAVERHRANPRDTQGSRNICEHSHSSRNGTRNMSSVDLGTCREQRTH